MSGIANTDIKPSNMPRHEIPWLGYDINRRRRTEEQELDELAYRKDEGRLRRAW